MKKKFRILSLLLLVSMLFSFVPPAFSEEAVDTTHYDMNITFDENTKVIKGEEVVSFKNQYNTNLKEIVFHLYPDSYNNIENFPALSFFGESEEEISKEILGDIHIEKVSIDNKNMKYIQDKQVLKIPLDNPLKSGGKIEIKIEFVLKMPMGRNRLGYFEDVYSFTNWYPILSIYDEKVNKWDENPYHPIGESNYSDIANYDVKMTVPKKMIVVPTGTIADETVNGANKTLTIKAENVRDFVFIMSEKYKKVTKSIDGIKIYNYYLDGKGKKKTAEAIVNEVGKAVSFFNKNIGKYPYKELRIAETSLAGGAMEYPQVIQMGYYPELSSYEFDDYVPWVIEAAVHEIVHQWWYVGVGSNEFKEPFLDESLTVFTTALYFEKEYGKYHGNGVSRKIRQSVYPCEIPPLNTSVDKFKDFGEYINTIYQKGPQIFEDLRQRVGEEKVLKILQNYHKKYLFKNATINDLLNVIEEVAGKDIRKIMEENITKPNYYPKNIELTEEEHTKIQVENRKKYLNKKEEESGLIVGSLILRCLNGEEVVFVKPTHLAQSADEEVERLIEEMNGELKIYGIDIKVIDENKMTKEDKAKNIIVLGYPSDSSIMKEIGDKLPINPRNSEIVINNINIKNENTTGMFITENPYNNKKLSLIIFLSDSNASKNKTNNIRFIQSYNPLYNEDVQFIINIENGHDIQIKGMYK